MTRCTRNHCNARDLLLLIAPVSWLGVGCSQQAPPAAELVRPVKTLVVAAGEATQERTFPGAVEASRRVELAFQVPGILVKLPIKAGQRVAQGDLIAQLRQD